MPENKTLNDIKIRRSIRNFKKEQISNDVLNNILEAALYAPSGSNHQLSRFTAIQNQDILEELNKVVRESFCEMPDEEANYFQAAAKRHAMNPSYNFYYNAPTLVIASNKAGYPNAMADCAAALENIFLAAASMGVGSCWINQLRWLNESPRLRDYLCSIGIPDDQDICGAAALGYAEGGIPAAGARRYDTIKIIR